VGIASSYCSKGYPYFRVPTISNCVLAVLELARAPSWAVLSGPAWHGWVGSVPCSVGIGSPSGGPARPGYLFGLKWAGLKRARAGPSRAARLDVYTSECIWPYYGI
jgi:hypothetical protein